MPDAFWSLRQPSEAVLFHLTGEETEVYRGYYCPSDKATDWDPVLTLEYFLLISVPESASPATLTLEYMYPWIHEDFLWSMHSFKAINL